VIVMLGDVSCTASPPHWSWRSSCRRPVSMERPTPRTKPWRHCLRVCRPTTEMFPGLRSPGPSHRRLT
jgi:hypothetical protein